MIRFFFVIGFLVLSYPKVVWAGSTTSRTWNFSNGSIPSATEFGEIDLNNGYQLYYQTDICRASALTPIIYQSISYSYSPSLRCSGVENKEGAKYVGVYPDFSSVSGKIVDIDIVYLVPTPVLETVVYPGDEPGYELGHLDYPVLVALKDFQSSEFPLTKCTTSRKSISLNGPMHIGSIALDLSDMVNNKIDIHIHCPEPIYGLNINTSDIRQPYVDPRNTDSYAVRSDNILISSLTISFGDVGGG